jgi:hypothetical protein
MARHVVHGAVQPFPQPFFEAPLVLVQAGAADADLLKTEFRAPGSDLPGQRRQPFRRQCSRGICAGRVAVFGFLHRAWI